MKRIEMINRLSLVGFSPRELSNKSNQNLLALYEQAKPLVAEKQEELKQVAAKERHKAHKAQQRAEQTRAQKEAEKKWLAWSVTHLPQPIVARKNPGPMVTAYDKNPDAREAAREVHLAEKELRQAKRRLKSEGGRQAMAACQVAEQKLAVWKGELELALHNH